MTQMTTKEIIEIAIRREEEAAAFYRKVAEMQKEDHIKQLFLDYAVEEDRHKEMLENLDISDMESFEANKVINLKIADHLAEVDVKPEMGYKDFLLIGMHREKRAYRAYMGLSESTDDPAVKNLFLKLAEEEAKHKLYFETLYDDYVLEEEED